MSTSWKAVVVFSLLLNAACLSVIASMSEKFVDAQRENLDLFLKLSSDQQSLRREFHAAKTRLDDTQP